MSGGSPDTAPRLAWPDLCKGVGILLVSLGHSAIPPGWLATWIYSFHMPLFFFLSGCFFSLKEGSLWKTLRHKAFPILMPYFAYSLARWLWGAGSALAAGGPVDFAPLLGILLQWPNTPYAGSVWFFTGLFAAECLFAVLWKAVKGRSGPLTALSFALAAAGWAYVQLGGARLPWHVDAACLLLPYLALGQVFHRHEGAILRYFSRKSQYLRLTLDCLALNLLFTALNRRLGPTRIDYNLDLLNEFFTCYLAGIAGIAFCVLLCRKLPPLRPLAFLGENSAVYYCVGWIGSNLAHTAVRALLPVTGYPLLMVHLLGMWLLPVPLILLLRRFCPALMGKRRPAIPPSRITSPPV